MIAHLRGKILEKGDGRAVIDVGGVGYLVFVPSSALDRLPSPGGDASLHTVLVVREDSLSLYGFPSTEERQAFEHLLSVNGVGPKMALGIISSLGVDGLRAAVASGDTVALARVPGVGKKTAERVALELRGKLDTLSAGSLLRPGARKASSGGLLPGDAAASEAAAALEALGYTPAEAAQTVVAVRRRLGVSAPVETLVRESLRELAGG